MNLQQTPPQTASASPLAPSQAGPLAPFRSKILAGLLAALLGWAGAHWWYLGRRYGWVLLIASLILIGTFLRAETWYKHPTFFLFLLPAIAGFIEALVLSLMSDARFDATYNPGHSRKTKTGWGPVWIAILTLLIGTSIMVTGIALLVEDVYMNYWVS